MIICKSEKVDFCWFLKLDKSDPHIKNNISKLIIRKVNIVQLL